MKDATEKSIVDYLEKVNFATVEEICNVTYSSASTVRRRLTALQDKGLVIRTHGGATLNTTASAFSDFSYRIELNAVAKKHMALLAVKYIKDGQTIFLDDSTSVYYMVKYLEEFKNLTVATSGIDTLLLLSKLHVNVFSTGGRIDDQNRSRLGGGFAEYFIENMHFDTAFFSRKAVDFDGNITDNNADGNFFLNKVMQNSDKSVFLCDWEKFGTTSSFKMCHLSDVDVMITDKNPKSVLKTDKLPEIVSVDE